MVTFSFLARDDQWKFSIKTEGYFKDLRACEDDLRLYDVSLILRLKLLYASLTCTVGYPIFIYTISYIRFNFPCLQSVSLKKLNRCFNMYLCRRLTCKYIFKCNLLVRRSIVFKVLCVLVHWNLI